MPPDPQTTPDPATQAAAAPGPPDAREASTSGGGRRRPPPSRLTPEAMAAARAGGAREGLEWLGREPEARASILYRLLRLVGRFILFGLFRFRIATSGQELLPRSGGYLLIGAAHRGWMDPFLVIHALPLEPRAWFLGSAPSTFTARWREVLIHRLGGLLPVWRGGLGVEQHVESARAVIRNGAVFAQMPEGTVSGPAGRIGPFRNGAALIALRTGAPIVPLAMAGTEELYIGRRMASEVLEPTSARALLGEDWDGTLPPEGSREELELARRLTQRFEQILGPGVERLHPQTVDPPGRPRRLARRLTWLFLRPGRLDRDEAT
jgi:1-acyl-sn-glycerol-3-phosphate acyltransferase